MSYIYLAKEDKNIILLMITQISYDYWLDKYHIDIYLKNRNKNWEIWYITPTNICEKDDDKC